MATCTTTRVRDPLRRTPTPRPSDTSRIITKRFPYQSLRSPGLLIPGESRPFSSIITGLQDSPSSDRFNIISPSTASYRSLYSDTEDENGSPEIGLGLWASNVHGNNLHTGSGGLNGLISPSAPVQLPGDEFLYTIDREEKPDEPFFIREFQAAFNTTKQEVKDISFAIWGSAASHQSGSDLHALKETAHRLSEFEPSRTKMVGFVGDSGVGKSSVINSLLDQPYLAHSNAGDGPSTSVITEYRYRAASCDEPFSIEVDYMTAEEVKELIEELLRSFRTCHSHSFQDVAELEERRDIRSRSERAWCTLQSMFRNQMIFTKEFLLEYPSEADTPLVNVLQQWAAKFLAERPGGAEARTWSTVAMNSDECTDQLAQFTYDPLDDQTPALWPFVRVVRVYTRAAILQSGVVLVDCPSPRHLNFARIRSTERYLRNCHEIFAVTTTSQAMSDKGVLDIVRRNNRHRPLRIICTKSEVIRPHEIERTDPEVASQVRTWRQQIETLHKQVKRSEAHRRHGIAGALQEEVASRDRLHDLEFVLKKFLVERRNRAVATQLIDKYADEVQNGDLKVFCVSNQDYWTHRHDEQRLAESRLDLSGIVDLRRYCHSIPAEAQFQAAAAFIEHEVPAFLGSLRQWAIGGADQISEEKADELCQVIKGLEEVAIKKLVLPSQVEKTRTNLNEEFTSAIVRPIRDHRSEWRNAALDTCKTWSKWDAKDYAAFCRQHGIHTTKPTGSRNWNEELIAPMRVHLSSNWDFFQETIEESQKELIEAINRVFDEICEPLREHLAHAPNSLQTLLSNITPRKASIANTITSSFTDLLEGTQQLESDALYGHTSSYINALMAPAYHSATTNADSDGKHLLATHIASTRIFPKIASMIEKSHRVFVRVIFEGLVEGVAREVDAFLRDLKLVVVRGKGESSDEEEGDMRRSKEERRAGEKEFVERLRARVGVAERRVKECGEVVRDLREMDDGAAVRTGSPLMESESGGKDGYGGEERRPFRRASA